jgi:hypothetical protein
MVFSCNLIMGRGSSYERVVQILAETPLVMRRTILEFPLKMGQGLCNLWNVTRRLEPTPGFAVRQRDD